MIYYMIYADPLNRNFHCIIYFLYCNCLYWDCLYWYCLLCLCFSFFHISLYNFCIANYLYLTIMLSYFTLCHL